MSPSRYALCETFNHDGSTWRVNGIGETLGSFCSREDCCTVGANQCASFWSTNISYSLCTGSCNGDRACQGLAGSASRGSVAMGPWACSTESGGFSCKASLEQVTGSVNVDIGKGSCSGVKSCYTLAQSSTNSADVYTITIGKNSCTSIRSCQAVGIGNEPGDYSVSIGDNSCQFAYACYGITQTTVTTSGVVVPNEECNGIDACRNCGSSSSYTGIFPATTNCC